MTVGGGDITAVTTTGGRTMTDVATKAEVGGGSEAHLTHTHLSLIHISHSYTHTHTHTHLSLIHTHTRLS